MPSESPLCSRLPAAWGARLALLIVALGGLFFASGAPSASSATIVTVDVDNYWFCDSSFQIGVCKTDIAVGDTVRWNFLNVADLHTTTHCGANCNTPTATPLFDSPLSNAGDHFDFTFTEDGSYLYYCEVHPIEMRGIITVHSGVGGIAELAPPGARVPIDASGGGSLGNDLGLLIGAASAAAAVVALALGGAVWRLRTRRS